MKSAERFIRDLFAEAGVVIDGSNPWDPRVLDERFYPRLIADKNLGLGEAYMDGWWECAALDEFIRRLLVSGARERVKGGVRAAWHYLRARAFNPQSRRGATQVAEHHYDLDNDLFLAFLDPHNQYSCGYFRDGCSLEQAQRNKLALIADKLDLQPGDRVLDIGCGWGGLARYMAHERGCSVTAVNISQRQMEHAGEACRGLDVKLKRMDYRDLTGEWGKIVSVGMFEHVGPGNYREYMETVRRCLSEDGRFLLHTIGANTSGHVGDPWMEKYIFPRGVLPSVGQIGKAAEGLLVMEDWHNFGPHYADTLRRWHENFMDAWPELSKRYDERFRRMWEYYLLSCAGAFDARENQLWQVVFTPPRADQPCCRHG